MYGDPISTRVWGNTGGILGILSGRGDFEMKWRPLELARMASQILGSNKDSFNNVN